MKKIFGSSSSAAGQQSGEQWMSVSDLMAGLMMVFMFISISLMRDAMLERDKIKEVAVTYQEKQQALYLALVEEFNKDLKSWGAEIDKETLSFNFTAPEVLFANGEARLTEKFKHILDDFFPRYLGVLNGFKDSIESVRLEGHTSSMWNANSTDSEAYFNNMALSQNRTRRVLHYVMAQKMTRTNYYDWVKAHVAAVGYASSKLVYRENGKEDQQRSRRVSFRVVTNAETQIRTILER
ncbi:OmpA/MotB family protein [Photobacterium kagoshimensis]|uniref:OmpA/MotB family protein n=1 Tax=Photobacterium kagoshimensis TaxID=2910242 RepID=UPI003D15207F